MTHRIVPIMGELKTFFSFMAFSIAATYETLHQKSSGPHQDVLIYNGRRTPRSEFGLGFYGFLIWLSLLQSIFYLRGDGAGGLVRALGVGTGSRNCRHFRQLTLKDSQVI